MTPIWSPILRLQMLFRERGMTSIRLWFGTFCGLAWGILRLEPPCYSLQAPRYCFLFCFVSRSYLTSGWFSWCNLFLISYSFIFLSCSNPGQASLSCTVKAKLPQHTSSYNNKKQSCSELHDKVKIWSSSFIMRQLLNNMILSHIC
jgi:hypothetical protein